MHIFFSGIGGAGIGPLALIAHEAGYRITGSDKQDSSYISYLKKHGITDIYIGQDLDSIQRVHQQNPIDWYVYSSAVAIEQPDSPELSFCRDNNIKTTKRDELLNHIIQEKSLKLITVAGTHGKSTTTAMIIWLFKQLGLPISYSVGAKLSFGEMGQYDKASHYFVYEADEFDYNFLSFKPYISSISGISYDHHEIFHTREAYQKAFVEFINQSETTIIWQQDVDYLPKTNAKLIVKDYDDPLLHEISLDGKYNRYDALLAVAATNLATDTLVEELVSSINNFPGLARRMEEIVTNLYSDYAHTPEKIRGGMSMALEMANRKKQDVIVLYEPLTDRRQHHILNDYEDCFSGAKHIYWLPSYLAREDPKQTILSPSELIAHLTDPSIASPHERDQELITIINQHLKDGDMVVGMNGGGGGSLDEWLREHF